MARGQFIKFKVTRAFFNTAAVRKRTDVATRSVLSKLGAFIRQTARQSIRRHKKESKPGNPPHSHTGMLKRFIFFFFGFKTRSVVIGPRKVKPAGPILLPALEYGGITKPLPRRKKGRRGKVRGPSVRIAARPFMGPALYKELPRLPVMWRDSVRR